MTFNLLVEFCNLKMENIQIKLNNKPLTHEELLQLSKEELASRIKSMEAHNLQLKNILAKSQVKRATRKTQKPFNFEKCNFRHVLLKFFYLGWDYHGYATQEDTINTIEHYLFNALTRTCLIKERTSSNYHRCGRTDKGVSSFGQVVSLDIRSKLSKEDQSNLSEEIDYCTVMNKVLPENIQCVAWSPVDEEFSARFDCKGRTYKYFFPKGNLDIEQMKKACKMLLGTHDFRNFCKMDVGNGVVQFLRCIVDVSIDAVNSSDNTEEYSMYFLTIKGKAFLWHQIRCIMGVLLLVGQKREKPEIIEELLDVEKNPRKPEYYMASEIPLNLYFCEYEDVQWHYSDESLREVLKKLRGIWTISSIKGSMMKTMLQSLEYEQSRLHNNTVAENKRCLSECLLQGVKAKKYVPVMKRHRCESLEEKVKQFAKRKRIEFKNPSKS